MKRIISILLITTLFAGELEVDGGITATGEIQSPTIQALLEQIAQLQEQIALLQAQVNASQGADNQFETRVYVLNAELITSPYYIDLFEITGHDLEMAWLGVVGVDDYSANFNDPFRFDYTCDGLGTSRFIEHYPNYLDGSANHIYTKNQECRLLQVFSNDDYNKNIFISVTAQFPNE